jgi:hypothetical protein
VGTCKRSFYSRSIVRQQNSSDLVLSPYSTIGKLIECIFPSKQARHRAGEKVPRRNLLGTECNQGRRKLHETSCGLEKVCQALRPLKKHFGWQVATGLLVEGIPSFLFILAHADGLQLLKIARYRLGTCETNAVGDGAEKSDCVELTFEAVFLSRKNRNQICLSLNCYLSLDRPPSYKSGGESDSGSEHVAGEAKPVFKLNGVLRDGNRNPNCEKQRKGRRKREQSNGPKPLIKTSHGQTLHVGQAAVEGGA